ncbi:MAG: acyl CoA:acetate/3-ketoacid CoA transferase [Nitrososphaerota archaeon]|nr:acyl CoA:acetate/3-ketoacid CoA transferase [Nitrososphaerota archaeon]
MVRSTERAEGIGRRRTGAVCTATDAVSAVKDGSVVAISGFNMANTPEYLILELHRQYMRTGHPNSLFVVTDALPATPGRGLDIVAKDLSQRGDGRFIRGITVPFFGFSPWLQRLVEDDVVEAYSWPMGVAAYWFREVASGRPGVISKIGIDTAIDPRKEGGKVNGLAAARNTCTVKRIMIGGQVYLLYEAPKPDVALVRASTADRRANLTMEDEVIRGTVLSMAQATKAHPRPGIVIAQVRNLDRGEAHPRAVEVPGPLVDMVVVSPKKYHWQVGSKAYDPAFGAVGKPMQMRGQDTMDPVEMVIARRVLVGLAEAAKKKGAPYIVNLGIGIPALVSTLAVAEGLEDRIVTVVESGQWGGVALPGVDFGAAVGPFALSTMPDMFSNFEGGIIDAAALGFLQVGRNGDVNPSTLPGRIYGPGGFPVIAGGSPRIYFAGAFTACGAKITIARGKLKVVKDGEVKKFVRRVYKNFFSGSQALKFGKEVAYVTERAVFRLTPTGLELTELAPGADIERDVLGAMEYKPAVSKELREMDHALFNSGPMRLAKRLGVEAVPW